jgi:hypothetical protein
MWLLALVFGAALTLAGAFPGLAQAHGPVAPVALDYLARVTQLPYGLQAKVVDGDQRMWLRAPPSETVVVLDYRGAPYLRFSSSGVAVNRNSAMWFLNQTPFALTPPTNLGRETPPRWESVSAAHEYGWHDGRLHALATVALRPGMAFVGTWRIPITVNGSTSVVSGGLWHAEPPSLAWFWPIAVILMCVLAAWRVNRPALDQITARILALSALGAVALAAIGRGLHGRPTVSILQFVELALILTFVVWAALRILRRRSGFFLYLVIAVAALWEGFELLPVLRNGFVLIALPAFVARAAAVVALGTGAGLLLLVFRLFNQREESAVDEHGSMDELAGIGS